MKWQARAENVRHLALWAEERERQKRKDDADLDELTATFNLGVTSKGLGSNATTGDDAMDVDKSKEDTTKKNGRTGGGTGSAVASGAHKST